MDLQSPTNEAISPLTLLESPLTTPRSPEIPRDPRRPDLSKYPGNAPTTFSCLLISRSFRTRVAQARLACTAGKSVLAASDTLYPS